tara:strand:- start:710 stop:1039 length:330 start_codon:yes stop_codon:yes gene_type:complete
MAVTREEWKIGNRGRYIEIPKDSTASITIDLQNELASGDGLLTCVATVPSGITLVATALTYDEDETFSVNHRQMLVLTPTAVGTYEIKTVSTTNSGYTIVKYFDVYTKE